MLRFFVLFLAVLFSLALWYLFGAWILFALFGVTTAIVFFSTRDLRERRAQPRPTEDAAAGGHTTTSAHF